MQEPLLLAGCAYRHDLSFHRSQSAQWGLRDLARSLVNRQIVNARRHAMQHAAHATGCFWDKVKCSGAGQGCYAVRTSKPSATLYVQRQGVVSLVRSIEGFCLAVLQPLSDDRGAAGDRCSGRSDARRGEGAGKSEAAVAHSAASAGEGALDAGPAAQARDDGAGHTNQRGECPMMTAFGLEFRNRAFTGSEDMYSFGIGSIA